MAHLAGGFGHAPANDVVAVLRPRLEPPLELGHRTRQYEHADEIARSMIAQLLRSLPVDVEHYVAAGRQCRLYRRARRSVAMIEHPGRLEQITVAHHGVEARLIDEMIVAAVNLAAPFRPRGDRDRELDPRVRLEQPARERGLAGARRRGQHTQA